MERVAWLCRDMCGGGRRGRLLLVDVGCGCGVVCFVGGWWRGGLQTRGHSEACGAGLLLV